jgi:hypothetical protein
LVEFEGKCSLEVSMNTHDNPSLGDEYARKVVLSKRLENFGWGVLLVTLGVIWLMPDTQVPPGSWLIAVGLILLGLNAIRYFKGIQMNGFSLIVGIVAMFAGLGEFFSVKLPLLAITLIVIGACVLLKPLVEKNAVVPTGTNWCCCGPSKLGGGQGQARGQGAGR